mmetsp:Transcript_20938/g.39798  ORF Transcript_20938/g.39798 Transcript_20938/m.39798 type:complete len:325 (-) Transcript_20938:1199-2173(-)
MHVCIVPQQCAHRARVAPDGCPHEGGVPVVVLCILIRPESKQRLQHIRPAPPRCLHQRRGAVLVLHVGADPRRRQLSNNQSVAVSDRPVHQLVALLQHAHVQWVAQREQHGPADAALIDGQHELSDSMHVLPVGHVLGSPVLLAPRRKPPAPLQARHHHLLHVVSHVRHGAACAHHHPQGRVRLVCRERAHAPVCQLRVFPHQHGSNLLLPLQDAPLEQLGVVPEHVQAHDPGSIRLVVVVVFEEGHEVLSLDVGFSEPLDVRGSSADQQPSVHVRGRPVLQGDSHQEIAEHRGHALGVELLGLLQGVDPREKRLVARDVRVVG